MPKVAYITSQFPVPSETFACNDVLTLKKMGVDVSVYTIRAKHHKLDELVKERLLSEVPIFPSTFLDYLKGLVLCLLNIRLFVQLSLWVLRNDFRKVGHCIRMLMLLPVSFSIWSRVRCSNYDVVHLFWGHYPSVVGRLLSLTNKDIKLTMFLGAYDLDMKLGVSASLAESVDIVFTHAKANIPLLRGMGIAEKKIRVVYRGVNIEKVETLDLNAKKKGLIVTGGRLITEKGYEEVLKRFSSLVSVDKSLKLIIFGDGPLKPKLERMADSLGINEYVKFLGHIDHDQVILELSVADLFVLMSTKKGECLPNVVKEAMLAQCVCFSTDTPGISELIVDADTGFIVDAGCLELRLKEYFALPEEDKVRIRTDSNLIILEKFDVKFAMNKYVEIWSRL